MVRNNIVFILTILGFIALSACSALTGDSGQLTQLPAIDSTCDPRDADECTSSLAGEQAYLGLSNDLNLDCQEALFEVLVKEDFYAQFWVHSRTTTYFESYLRADFSRYFDSNQNLQNSLEANTYRACLWIDSNGNGRADTNEPYAQSDLDISTDIEAPIDTWSNLNL